MLVIFLSIICSRYYLEILYSVIHLISVNMIYMASIIYICSIMTGDSDAADFTIDDTLENSHE